MNLELTDDEAAILRGLLGSMTIPMTLAQSRLLSGIEAKLATPQDYEWPPSEVSAFRDNIPASQLNGSAHAR